VSRLYEILDPLGSFRIGNVEAICWTHRGGGWNVIDGTTGKHHAVKNGREARLLARRLVEAAS
jgi:hypothetical protein